MPDLHAGRRRRKKPLVADHEGPRDRAAYTVRFKAAVYVLHAFQKKAKRGAETPRPDIELVRSRLRTAEQHYGHAYGEEQVDGQQECEG